MRYVDLPANYQVLLPRTLPLSHPEGEGSSTWYRYGCRCDECVACKTYENRTRVRKVAKVRQRKGESDEDFRLRQAYAETEPSNYVGL